MSINAKSRFRQSLSNIGLNNWLLIAAVVSLFALGFYLRMIDVTNPPLDFHAWRQLRSAIISRGMFYQMMPAVDPVLKEKAIAIANTFDFMEPPIMESLVAITYRVMGSENLWVARLYEILIWMIGSVGVYLLATRMTSVYGGLISLAYFLLLPFGIYASRAFMPDPLMVTWIVLSAYALYRWNETPSWKWTVIAGIFSGMAVLTKIFAVYPIAVIAILMTLYNNPLRKIITNRKVWALAAIMILIPSLYYLLLVGNKASSYISGWVLTYDGLLIQVTFYKRWADFLHSYFDLTIVLVSLVSMIILSGRGRILMLGMWVGYLLIGMTVPSLIITHSYYNLFAVPVVALSLAPAGHLILTKITQQGKIWQLLATGIALVGILFSSWNVRTQLLRSYHEEVKGWIKMGNELPKGARIIGLTHDYNTRVEYYGWTALDAWPFKGDMDMGILAGGNENVNDPYWNDYFKMRAKNADYFLITTMGELDLQPLLKQNLSHYPSTSGEGYILYDLRQKK